MLFIPFSFDFIFERILGPLYLPEGVYKGLVRHILVSFHPLVLNFFLVGYPPMDGQAPPAMPIVRDTSLLQAAGYHRICPSGTNLGQEAA